MRAAAHGRALIGQSQVERKGMARRAEAPAGPGFPASFGSAGASPSRNAMHTPGFNTFLYALLRSSHIIRGGIFSMSQSAQNRIERLRKELNHHNHLYHVFARPEISDREYDKLMQELIDLEAKHPEFASADSPTQRVGGDAQSELQSVRHAVPMMSIDNTYSEAEVRAFDERVRKALDGQAPAYVLEPKIDGASVSLRFEDGRLVLAATRGAAISGTTSPPTPARFIRFRWCFTMTGRRSRRRAFSKCAAKFTWTTMTSSG